MKIGKLKKKINEKLKIYAFLWNFKITLCFCTKALWITFQMPHNFKYFLPTLPLEIGGHTCGHVGVNPHWCWRPWVSALFSRAWNLKAQESNAARLPERAIKFCIKNSYCRLASGSALAEGRRGREREYETPHCLSGNWRQYTQQAPLRKEWKGKQAVKEINEFNYASSPTVSYRGFSFTRLVPPKFLCWYPRTGAPDIYAYAQMLGTSLNCLYQPRP